jgi:ABC-type sugar transport system substrate-binding protein
MAEAKRILASFLTQEQEFQRLQAEDAKQAGARDGLRVEVIFADNNAVLQIQQLYAAVHAPPEQRPAAIVVETVAGEGLERVARKAAATGIGWVLINRNVSYLEDLRRQYPRLVLSSIGTDQAEVGRIQASQLKVLAPAGGTVLCVTGPGDTSVAQERLSGLQGALPPGMVMKVLEGRWTEASGTEAVRRWLRLESSHGITLAAVACQNDAMAVGAGKALEAHRGTVGARRVPVIGCDGLEQGGRLMVNAGTLAATIVTPSNGGPAVQLVARALQTGVMPPSMVRLTPSAYPSIDNLARGTSEARKQA